MTREEAIDSNLCLLEYMKINNKLHPETPFLEDDFVALKMANKALETIPKYKDAYNKGYEAGVRATNIDCGVVWEERIDAIKAEAEKAKEQVYDAPQDVYEPDFYVREGIDFVLELIDKHCGGEISERNMKMWEEIFKAERSDKE